jgi:hypothetical protein
VIVIGRGWQRHKDAKFGPRDKVCCSLCSRISTAYI